MNHQTPPNAMPASPVLTPPEAQQTQQAQPEMSVGLSQPEPMTEERLAEITFPGASPSAPTQAPPAAQAIEAQQAGVIVAPAAGVAARWHMNTAVSAMWAINEPRNAWIHLANVGWRRIYNGRDGAFTALVTLASQARQTGRPVNLREENDGMIHQIYLW